MPKALGVFVVELVLDAALAGILHADRTQHLRRQIARRIKALRLLLEVNSLQLQRIDALDGLVIGLASHPAKRFVRTAIRKHDDVVVTRNARDEVHSSGKILDLSGNGKCGIDQNGHGQLVAGAVVDDSTLRGQRDGTLLLMSGLLDEPAVTEDLQVYQAPADGKAPQEKDCAQQVEPGVLAGSGIGRHGKLAVRRERRSPLVVHFAPSALSS